MSEFTAEVASHSGLDSAKKQYYTYMKFAGACKARLKRFCKENPTKTSMVYAVPLVLPGAALFDPRMAINHVIHCLIRDGFKADYLGENLIFIHWDIKDLPQFQVHDYVASSLVKSKNPLKIISATGALQGPGNAYRESSQRIAHSRHMDSEVKRRMDMYKDSDINKTMRRVYNNSTTHDQVMNRVARFHSIL